MEDRPKQCKRSAIWKIQKVEAEKSQSVQNERYNDLMDYCPLGPPD